MIHIHQEKDCCGCGACAAACPQHCISLRPGTLGALFPTVDLQACLHCGKCLSVCPMQEEYPNPADRCAYAAYTKDETLLQDSSSGGMFGTFARAVLQKGGVVFGAAFDESLQLKCTAARNEAELKPLLKSKYLQSNMGSAYSEIKSELDSGKAVLFTGTPCQAAALKSFLKKPYENLLTVDFFCHGVPSQDFFDKCRAYVEQKYAISLKGYGFREKFPGCASPHYFSYDYEKRGKRRKKTRLYFHSPFYAAFQTYLPLRESCYACPFAKGNRAADITIGDFHAIEKYIPGIDRFRGVSTVIINTPAGQAFFDNCKDRLWLQATDYSLLQKNGDCFPGSTRRPQTRDAFILAVENDSLSSVIDRYFPVKKYWKNNIFYHLPKPLRNFARRFVSGGSL